MATDGQRAIPPAIRIRGTVMKRHVFLCVFVAFVTLAYGSVLQGAQAHEHAPPPCMVSKPPHHHVKHRPCRPRTVVVQDWKRVHWLEEQLARVEADLRHAREDFDEARAEIDRLKGEIELVQRKAEQDIKAAQEQAKIEVEAAKRRAEIALEEAARTMRAAQRLSDEANKKLETAKQIAEANRQKEAELIKGRGELDAAWTHLKELEKQANAKMAEAVQKMKGAELLRQTTAEATAKALQQAQAEIDAARKNQADAVEAKHLAELEQKRAAEEKEKYQKYDASLKDRWEKIFNGLHAADPYRAAVLGQPASAAPK
jgi:peptidoglycan hydrolase CwlO-like protein